MTMRSSNSSKWHAIGQLLTGGVLGVALTLGSFALAGKLRPPDEPQALIALAQIVSQIEEGQDAHDLRDALELLDEVSIASP